MQPSTDHARPEQTASFLWDKLVDEAQKDQLLIFLHGVGERRIQDSITQRVKLCVLMIPKSTLRSLHCNSNKSLICSEYFRRQSLNSLS
jgi:hypothetical protein